MRCQSPVSPELQLLLWLSCIDQAVGIPAIEVRAARPAALGELFAVAVFGQVPTNQSRVLPDDTGTGPNAQQPYSQPPAAQPPFQQQPLLCSKCGFARLMLTGSYEIYGA